MPRTIEQQIKSTYFNLRVGAAVIAFVFPLLLLGGVPTALWEVTLVLSGRLTGIYRTILQSLTFKKQVILEE